MRHGVRRLPRWATARNLHLALTLLWALLVVPTLLWWRESIFWIALMSIYACITGHWSSYQAARAEDEANSDS